MTSLNGSALLTRFYQKFGFSDTTSQARVLEWINEIQLDIASGFDFPFLKIPMKKYIAANTIEVDLSPQIPDAPVLAALADGSLTADVACLAKVCFVLFDETGREFGSIESEPSDVSNSITPTGSNLSLTVSSIDTYDGDSSYVPTKIWRRIYLSQNGGAFYLAKTIEDNTTTSTTITANPSSTVEPPEFSMASHLSSDDPTDRASGIALRQESIDNILKYDPNLTSSGTVYSYARLSERKIHLYPKPSAAFTLSYYLYKRPAQIFNDTSRIIQLLPEFKTLLDSGVTWKGYEYKDLDGQESKRNNYENLKREFRAKYIGKSGIFGTVKEVC